MREGRRGRRAWGRRQGRHEEEDEEEEEEAEDEEDGDVLWSRTMTGPVEEEVLREEEGL